MILGVFGLENFTCRHYDITSLGASDTVESGRGSKVTEELCVKPVHYSFVLGKPRLVDEHDHHQKLVH